MDGLEPGTLALIDQRVMHGKDVLREFVRIYQLRRALVGETQALVELVSQLHTHLDYKPSMIDLIAIAVIELADRQDG